ncbi:cell division protein SepF [Actinoplanes sp. CA-054009]
MSAIRKAGVWLGLVEEDEDRDYGYREDSYHQRDRRYSGSRYENDIDEDDEEFEEERTVPRARTERPARRLSHTDVDEEPEERAERASVRSITRSGSNAGDSALSYSTRENLALAPQTVHAPPPAPRPVEEEQRYQITTLHPTTYREARTIGEHFRDGVPVIINLTEMDEGDARRLVDFAAGLAFGLRGTIERVTNRVFLLSPANVQVTAEDKAKIAEGGFFSQG